MGEECVDCAYVEYVTWKGVAALKKKQYIQSFRVGKEGVA